VVLNGMTFKPDFVKIGTVAQTLKYEGTHREHGDFTSLLFP